MSRPHLLELGRHLAFRHRRIGGYRRIARRDGGVKLGPLALFALGNVLWQYGTSERERFARMTMTAIDLQKAAKDHLWMHFTRMGGYATQDVPIIVRGEGCYLEDVEREAVPGRARRASSR